jgi:hypothetical protein
MALPIETTFLEHFLKAHRAELGEMFKEEGPNGQEILRFPINGLCINLYKIRNVTGSKKIVFQGKTGALWKQRTIDAIAARPQ